MSLYNIRLPDIVGSGYREFWHFKGRYRVVKGGRASKKSKTTALNIIVRMMQYPGANTLVVRKVYKTLKDSCYTELKWAVRRLRAERFWVFKESPLEMVYRPTGQRIYFRGLDDPQKITSIAAEHGAICWLWLEEAFEVTDEQDFMMLDESIRGAALPSRREQLPLFKQLTLTFNPWNERHWLNERFFKRKPPDTLAITTDYRCNEWLDDADRRLFAEMKKQNPRRYQVAGLGNWGVTENLIYENWRVEAFEPHTLCEMHPKGRTVFGLDFGYTNDPSALFCAYVCGSEIYVFDELYETRLTNRALFERIEQMGYRKERIRADAAEPKSIEELRGLGLQNITAARKGADSVRNGIQFIQGHTLIVHPCCKNFIAEISCYAWSRDNPLRPAPSPDHLMDAMRYAMESFGGLFSF